MAEREILRQRNNIYAARYRATHRLYLLAEGIRYRQEISPDAIPRVVSLRHSDEYTEDDLILVGLRDAEKRCIQDRVKGIGRLVTPGKDEDFSLVSACEARNCSYYLEYRWRNDGFPNSCTPDVGEPTNMTTLRHPKTLRHTL